MQKITTFITFNNQAEAAVNLYVSVFKNSKIVSMNRYGEGGPGPKGVVMSASFLLEGQEFMALNGGPHFTFAEGISLFVSCETQAEVDELWEKLAEGGEKGRCGWLKDKFGVSWQITPANMSELIGKNPAKVMPVMLKMKKIDIAALQAAGDGK